jgi:nucleoside-diphosphate-sugar epimerase
VAQALSGRVRLLALTSSVARIDVLRARGITPLQGNLDEPASLRRLAGLCSRVLHLAPPPAEGWADTRTLALIRALRLRRLPQAMVYASTSGVYGDCQGELALETRAVHPGTPRASRRVEAEDMIRFLGRATPVLQAADDVYTNHIHADDLARACLAALWRGKAQRVYNVNDDSCLKMGDYFDLAADLYGLPRPPRVPRSTAREQLPLLLLSFMSESRRMDNTRMKRELRLQLRYPTVEAGL